MNAKISEKFKVDAECLPLTSAAGNTSQPYDLANHGRAMITVSVLGTYSTVRVDLMQTSQATAAMTSAAAGTTGRQLGGVTTNIPAAGGARAILLTMASATGTTDAAQFTLGLGTAATKKFIYTTSTALYSKTSAFTSSKLYFGSTVGSTVNTGIALSIDSLKIALASTLGFGAKIAVVSTPTTDSIGLAVSADADGAIAFNTTNAFYTALVNQAAAEFDVRIGDLTTGQRFVGAKCGTLATGVGAAAITVIRGPGRHNPPTFVGKDHGSTA